MHSIKGEAQMINIAPVADIAEQAERLVDTLLAADQWPEQAGNALLGSFEAMSVLAPEVGAEPKEVTEEACARLEAAISTIEQEGGPRGEATRVVAERAPKAPSDAGKNDKRIAVEDLEPVVNELRRLFSEQGVLYPQLHEIRKKLHTLLQQIDPNVSPEQLAEDIVKTLGFGVEIERRLGTLSAEWSTNEYVTTVTLDQLETLVRRASIVSVARLEAQIVRAVRAAADLLDKKVDVSVTGDADIDTGIERRLGPSLMHIVRNAVDHGIELPADRLRAGKDERGKVTVQISQSEAMVRVVVEDDGGGIAFDQVRATLAEHRPEAAQMSDADVLRAIFEHGVTGRRDVTTLSGRGVGLDVVATEVMAIGGRVWAETEAGIGTRVVLVMPATLRVDTVIPFWAGASRCAVPTPTVTAITRLREVQRTSKGAMTKVEIDETSLLIPVRSLSEILGQRGEPQPGDIAAIIETPRGVLALTVDGYDNPRPLITQPVLDPAVQTPLIKGIAPLPDGSVLLLLNVATLYDEIRVTGPVTGESASRRRQHVLVVEDALVARELLVGLLRTFGLRVSEAIDGGQGLAMASEDPPDLILTDIEMPVMDGFEMIEQIRENRALRGTPIVVLTTRSDDATRERARALGVIAFISKRNFVEHELRALIEKALGSGSVG